MDLRSSQEQLQDIDQTQELREAVLHSGASANPALQRLQARVRKGAEASEVITSYDRMHHRHNRS